METWGHSFSTCAKLSQKLTFLSPDTQIRGREVRNVSFSENVAYVLNEWPPLKNETKTTTATAITKTYCCFSTSPHTMAAISSKNDTLDIDFNGACTIYISRPLSITKWSDTSGLNIKVWGVTRSIPDTTP